MPLLVFTDELGPVRRFCSDWIRRRMDYLQSASSARINQWNNFRLHNLIGTFLRINGCPRGMVPYIKADECGFCQRHIPIEFIVGIILHGHIDARVGEQPVVARVDVDSVLRGHVFSIIRGR